MKKLIKKITTKNKKNNKKKGFTIVELIAVMAIITILSAALVPKITNYLTDAKKVSVLSDAKTIVTTYYSMALKDDSLTDQIRVSDLAVKDETNTITDKMVAKFDSTITIAECINMLDTENYTFEFDGKVASSPTLIGSTENGNGE